MAEQTHEPTKEELLARIAELEKQSGSKRKGSLEFRVGDRAAARRVKIHYSGVPETPSPAS